MKKFMTAILAAGITFSSMAAVAAADGYDIGESSAATIEISVEKTEKTARDLYKEAAPFLTKKITLRNMAIYTPYSVNGQIAKEIAEQGISFKDKNGGVAPFGQLIITSDEGDFSAFVMNMSFEEKAENKKSLDEFFSKKQDTASLGALMVANLYLMGAEPMINEAIVSNIREHNRTSADKLPEDFARVQLKDIEPITRLDDNTYTVGARIIGEADGFLLPIYLRTYFMKKGNRYRVLAAITSDAERNYMKPSLEELIKTSFTL